MLAINIKAKDNTLLKLNNNYTVFQNGDINNIQKYNITIIM